MKVVGTGRKQIEKKGNNIYEAMRKGMRERNMITMHCIQEETKNTVQEKKANAVDSALYK